MRTLIYNTETRAKTAAKTEAIRQAEKLFQKSYTTKTERNLRLNKNWMIRYADTQCVCGQTVAVCAVLFHRSQQFIGVAGFCKSCGSQYPMP